MSRSLRSFDFRLLNRNAPDVPCLSGHIFALFCSRPINEKTLTFFRIITIFVLSLGTLHIDESVFASSLNGNLAVSVLHKEKRCTHHLAWIRRAFPAPVHNRCGVPFICAKVARASIQISDLLHTFLFTRHHLGAGVGRIVYECY